MAKIVFAFLIILLSVVVIASFFQPWVRADISVTKVASNLANAANDQLKDTPFAGKFIRNFTAATNVINSLGDVEIKTQVSGYDIPTLINKKSSKVAVSLVQVMVKDVEGLDKKSLLVYLIPVFAAVCIVLAIAGLKNKLAIIPIIFIAGAISMPGLYNIFTADLSKLPVQVAIMNGLWQTMYGYLLMFVISTAWFIMQISFISKARNRKR